MSRGTVLRQIFTLLIILAIFASALRLKLDPNRTALVLTAAICAATIIYVSLTFEILLQNRSMAKAASESAVLMERGLRFSHAANLHYQTIITRDPRLQNRKGCTPVENEEYRNAMRLIQGNAQQQMEFVFCIVKNVGHGAATNIKIITEYRVKDTSNAIAQVNVPKVADVQLLEPDKSIALLVYLFKVPTTDDKAEIVQATLTSSDAYRDAIREQPVTITIKAQDHHSDLEAGCVARLS
jgi:hypothetical protein